MTDDEQLETRLRSALRALIPDPPIGDTLLARARERMRRRRRIMAAGVGFGAAAVVAAVTIPITVTTTGSSHPVGASPMQTAGAPDSSAEASSPPVSPVSPHTGSTPAWALKCYGTSLPGHSAQEYIGMTSAAVVRLATAHRFRVDILGRNGRCDGAYDLVQARHVWVVLSADGHVIAARRDW